MTRTITTLLFGLALAAAGSASAQQSQQPIRIGFHAPLDVQKLREAAALLVGEHDFSAFRSSECQAKSPVRRIDFFQVEKIDETIRFVVRANAFLHHMVRNLVGTLVYVGKGQHPPQWVSEVRKSKDRAKAAPTFGPQGLYLETIQYEPKWGLPI